MEPNVKGKRHRRDTKPINPKELVRLLLEGHSLAFIAKELGCNVETVRRNIKAAGLPNIPKLKRLAHTRAIAEEFARAVEDGATLQAIADQVGITRERVRQQLASIGVKTRIAVVRENERQIEPEISLGRGA